MSAQPRVVVWYSDGAASAVAAKLALKQYGKRRVVVVKNDTTNDEHPDNLRFRKDVERWLGVEVILTRSVKYSGIDHVFMERRYMSGIAGAICTTELKKIPGRTFRRDDDIHVFGYTADEASRATLFEANNPELTCAWVLIDARVTKADCLAKLERAGIRLPAMYALGFDHNNCLGCVKAQSPAYWNRTRREFPEVFERRARQCRELGVKLVRIGIGKGKRKRIFLHELPADYGLEESDGDIECGPFCRVDEPEEPAVKRNTSIPPWEW